MSNTDVCGQSLAYVLATDFAIQFCFYSVSAILKTEKLYDGSASLTYLACVLIGLLLRKTAALSQDNTIASLSARQIIAAVLVMVWAVRLGTFLFIRVQSKPDARFDTLKTNPVKFAVPWLIQVAWIFLTAFPVYVVLGNIASLQTYLKWSDIVGIVIWVLGFLVEVNADSQKNAFKNANPTKFMRTGLFKYSRYPNYFGEVTLWIGMFILCAGGFTDTWQWVAVISPIFVFCLIYFVSGVPLLEKSAEKRYGNDPEYISYKARTSKFILWFPKREEVNPLNPSATAATP